MPRSQTVTMGVLCVWPRCALRPVMAENGSLGPNEYNSRSLEGDLTKQNKEGTIQYKEGTIMLQGYYCK